LGGESTAAERRGVDVHGGDGEAFGGEEGGYDGCAEEAAASCDKDIALLHFEVSFNRLFGVDVRKVEMLYVVSSGSARLHDDSFSFAARTSCLLLLLADTVKCNGDSLCIELRE
jgi:hypothetical protein